MKKLKFVVALIFTSFCFFANAESVSTDLVMEKTSQNINAPNDMPEIKTIDVLLEFQNIDFPGFDSNTDLIAKYHSSQRLKPDKSFVYINDNRFHRLTAYHWILSEQPDNSAEKYKPHISYQF